MPWLSERNDLAPVVEKRLSDNHGRTLYEEGMTLKRAGMLPESVERFRSAANLGHAPAAYEMGEAYNQGRGIAQDPEIATQWFNRAAALGDARAQFIAGAAYYTGAGVKRDYTIAAAHLTRAAGQGHARAQFLLAEAFANGHGVAKDLAWAARWYGKAARQGHTEAQFAYGVVNATALGLPSNDVAAYAWLSLAAEKGHPSAADVRKAVGRRMTAAERTLANAQTVGFKPRPSGTYADVPTVMYVQHTLNALGYRAGPVDGLAGPRTRSALSAYQSAAGMFPDGELSQTVTERILADSQRTKVDS